MKYFFRVGVDVAVDSELPGPEIRAFEPQIKVYSTSAAKAELGAALRLLSSSTLDRPQLVGVGSLATLGR